MARGISPQITQVLLVKDMDLSTPQSQSLIFLNMLPFLLTMVIFTGGMYLCDRCYGRRTGARLVRAVVLNQPGPPQRFCFGLTAGFAAFCYRYADLLPGYHWDRFQPGAAGTIYRLPDVGQPFRFVAYFLDLPAVGAAGLRFADDPGLLHPQFKEAQTYLSFLPLVVGIPSAFLVFLPVKPSPGLMLIQVLRRGC